MDLVKNMEIINAKYEDLDILSDILLKAFESEPMSNWTVKNDNKRLQRIKLMQETIIKFFGFPYGEVFTNEDKTSCAVWIKPENFFNISFTSLSLILAWVKTVGIERIPKILKTANILSKHQPKFKCYYLMSLGVIPEHQGKGIGSKLIKPILDKCDKERIPIYLETSNKDNLRFYEKHGFRIKDEINNPSILPLTWTMIREPKL
ncbi:MAG: GNAT family N-acetyltransferase [Candidatus Sericytochromatia bacterium]